MTDSVTSEQQVPGGPDMPTREEWAAAWKMFRDGIRKLDELGKREGTSVKLTVPTLGFKKLKKVKKS